MRTLIYPSLILLFAALSSIAAFAQKPIKWSFTAVDAGNCQVDLIFTGTLIEGWYTYSQFLESEDGPVATSIAFEENASYKLLGKAKESGEIVKVHDAIFNMDLTKFKHKAILTQRVEVKDLKKPIIGHLTYMACNDEMCLPPKEVEFFFTVPVLAGCSTIKN
ncbi:MAG: protein-disulfide reductase DsbD domain-containing protein [Saprospiraceae bacterium]